MTKGKQEWGRRLACGCALGYERCMDCRPGLDPDQETALKMAQGEPFWATKKDAFGEPIGRYSWRGIKQGWSCHHCGGLFRGLPRLLEHQEQMIARDYANGEQRKET